MKTMSDGFISNCSLHGGGQKYARNTYTHETSENTANLATLAPPIYPLLRLCIVTIVYVTKLYIMLYCVFDGESYSQCMTAL